MSDRLARAATWLRAVADGVHGHAWTLGPHLVGRATAPRRPSGEPFVAYAEDPALGRVRLSGRLERRDARVLALLVHGLGGSADSPYMLRAARAARSAGVSSLRLNLRGADRSGEDFYHAGLIEDLAAALRSPELARYEQIVIFGFSLGGHVTLRYAIEAPDPRVRAVASVCAPLELASSAVAIDRPERWLYRRHVLAGLKEIYAEVARRRPVPLAPERAARISSLFEWDDRTVAPRHGFASAAAYYDAVSVGPRLREVRRPALVVAARHDPMVPENTVRSSLDRARSAVDVRWIDRGGHVGFPPDADLGVSKAVRGLESQVIGWLLDQA